MKTCPRCGYENNRDSALMCGLCSGVFASAETATTTAAAHPLGHFRKDFAHEISDNKIASVSLLIALPIIIALLGLAFDLWFGTEPMGVLGAIAIAIVVVFFAYYSGDQEILTLSGAREAVPERDQQLINVVDEMRIAAGLPMPKVYVMDTDAANAFATGRDPQHASIAVTSGLMNTLNREELQGVIGHEMSHIRNFDIRYMMLVSALVGAVVLLADGMRRGAWWGGRIGRRARGAGPFLAILAIVLVILAPLFALLLQMAISRKREFLADASSVELTRNPLALANALEKLETRAVTEPLPNANRATQHLFIVNPLRSFQMNASALLSTHPATEARVRVLRAMA